MPRTTLFKTESSRRQMFQIPASMKSMLGKPASDHVQLKRPSLIGQDNRNDCSEKPGEENIGLWLAGLRQTLVDSWVDTWTDICAHFIQFWCFHFWLILACLHHRVGSTRSYVHHAPLCSIRKCKANACTKAFALSLRSARTRQFQLPTQTQWSGNIFHWLLMLKGAPF